MKKFLSFRSNNLKTCFDTGQEAGYNNMIAAAA